MKSYRIIPMSLIGLAVLAIDQLTKYFVVTGMQEGESVPVLGKYFMLTSHRNSGAAWGMFQGQMLFFYLVTLLVLGILIYVYVKEAKGNTLLQLALTLLLAGALGNFIDRILFQEVVDFIDVLIVFYDFPIFNIADSALTIGVILMILEFFIIGKGDTDAGN
ncbi:signal peptidase II [Salinicoccus jeotgali]|uniref:Lipoprotein signal peptidase n=1 Tax=Salinicoccus jeotgali TaxID=381634 RepID=A0ABP7EHP6_9STAP